MSRKDVSDVPAELRTLVAGVIELDESDIGDETHFIEDLGVGSLIVIEIVVTLEKAYHVKITEVELGQMTCLRRVHELLLAKKGAYSRSC
jgi:acyl carrier protein